MRKSNKKGFTIVELVIVIAVIAILSAVLIPTFGNVVKKAQNAALIQEIKNEHTNYVTQMASSEEYSDSVYILIDGVYYYIDNGAIEMNGAEMNAPVPYYTKPDSGVFFCAKHDRVLNEYTPGTDDMTAQWECGCAG